MKQLSDHALGMLRTPRDILLAWHNVRKQQIGGPVGAEYFYPVDPAQLVKTVLNWDLEEGVEVAYGALGFCNFDSRTIRINTDQTPGQRSFTLAHEIAHAVLHRGRNYDCMGGVVRIGSKRKLKFYREPAILKVEREADVFAIGLLMPEKAVRMHFESLFHRGAIRADSKTALELYRPHSARYPRYSLSKLEVAKAVSTWKPRDEMRSLIEYFGVSEEAMGKRLLELGLVN